MHRLKCATLLANLSVVDFNLVPFHGFLHFYQCICKTKKSRMHDSGDSDHLENNQVLPSVET